MGAHVLDTNYRWGFVWRQFLHNQKGCYSLQKCTNITTLTENMPGYVTSFSYTGHHTEHKHLQGLSIQLELMSQALQPDVAVYLCRTSHDNPEKLTSVTVVN